MTLNHLQGHIYYKPFKCVGDNPPPHFAFAGSCTLSDYFPSSSSCIGFEISCRKETNSRDNPNPITAFGVGNKTAMSTNRLDIKILAPYGD